MVCINLTNAGTIFRGQETWKWALFCLANILPILWLGLQQDHLASWAWYRQNVPRSTDKRCVSMCMCPIFPSWFFFLSFSFCLFSNFALRCCFEHMFCLEKILSWWKKKLDIWFGLWRGEKGVWIGSHFTWSVAGWRPQRNCSDQTTTPRCDISPVYMVEMLGLLFLCFEGSNHANNPILCWVFMRRILHSLPFAS